MEYEVKVEVGQGHGWKERRGVDQLTPHDICCCTAPVIAAICVFSFCLLSSTFQFLNVVVKWSWASFWYAIIYVLIYLAVACF